MLLFSILTLIVIGLVIIVIDRVHWHATHPDDYYLYVPRRPHSRYRTRASLLGNSEQRFYEELKRQLSQRYIIFTKIRVADVIEATNGRQYYKNRNAVLPKHFDFVIASLDYAPLIALELNGASHRRPDRAASDAQKRAVCAEAGLAFETIHVGSNFAEEIRRIIADYKLV